MKIYIFFLLGTVEWLFRDHNEKMMKEIRHNLKLPRSIYHYFFQNKSKCSPPISVFVLGYHANKQTKNPCCGMVIY